MGGSEKGARGKLIFMEWLTILLLLAVLGALVYLLVTRNTSPQDSQGMLLLQQRIQELEKTLEGKLGEGTNRMFESMRAQFGESQRLASDIRDLVAKQLTEVKVEQTKTNEATTRFMGIAEQLANLEKVLKHQKQRGNLGEASLELILGNILPPGSYKMQYEFPGGETVDAIIITKEGMIPIDAKFSLDNYQRLINAIDDRQREELEKDFKNDLKMRITETSKYIQPNNGTMDFAFMFIPHEAIYYDLLIGKVGLISEENLIQRAASKYKVIIVSPTSFLAYLQTVLQGLNAMKIEEKAQDIIGNVQKLQQHLKSYEEYHQKLGNSLSTTINQYNLSGKEFKKVDKDMLRITGETMDIDLQVLDKPEEN